MSELLDAAIRFANHGWPVFPCRPHLKPPCTPNGLKAATTDTGLIEAWWMQQWPGANIGLATGRPSGLVVLDVDGEDGAEALRALERRHQLLPRTASVVTPSGGSHYYFRHPGGDVRSSASKLARGLDVRGDGGYVLAPPSEVGGRRYEVDERCAPAAMPTWLLDAIRERHRQDARTPVNEWMKIVRDGVRGPTDTAPSEGRNAQLTALVGHLLRRYVDGGLALELARLVNTRCRPPLPDYEVVQIVQSVASMELRRRQAKASQMVTR